MSEPVLPPFSLLLPVYAGDVAWQLERAFASSVVEQTLRPAEVVLVQDGPVGPQLAAAIEALGGSGEVPVRVVRLERNGGLAHALQAGLAACSHEVVARMDADDVSLPVRFARQIPLIARGCDLVGTGMFEFMQDDPGGEERVVAVRTPPVGAERIVRFARFHDPFNHPTVVFRKDAVLRVGGYEDLGSVEDYWLFARMIAAGSTVANVAEPLLMYRVDGGAYRRRGGWRLVRSEWLLQRAFLRISFTTRAQFVRNVAVRGAYRLIPMPVRRSMYRTVFASGARASR